MKKVKITRNFLRMNDPQLENKAQFVLAGMTGNAYFPNPVPSIADFTVLLGKFSDARKEAQHGDRMKIVLKNDLRTELRTQMSRWADYVSLSAVNDRAAQMTSNFTLNAETATVTLLGEIVNFTAKQGKNSGEAIVSLKRVKGAKFYLFYFIEGTAATDAMGWMHKGNTASKKIIVGLKPATLCSFYVKVFGTNEQEIDSAVITKMFL